MTTNLPPLLVLTCDNYSKVLKYDIFVDIPLYLFLFLSRQGLLRARVNQVRRGKQPVYAGVISKQTHVTCRSRSSRIFWLVQVRDRLWSLVVGDWFVVATESKSFSNLGRTRICMEIKLKRLLLFIIIVTVYCM